VAALGVGAAHDGPAPTTESLSAAEIPARAAAVAGEIRPDGAAVAAGMLLDLLRAQRLPAPAGSTYSSITTSCTLALPPAASCSATRTPFFTGST
jgi:hypothetical protein